MGCSQSKKDNKKEIVQKFNSDDVNDEAEKERVKNFNPRKTNIDEVFSVEKNWENYIKKIGKNDEQKLKWAKLIYECIWGEIRYKRPEFSHYDYSDCKYWIMNIVLLRLKRPAIENPGDSAIAEGWKELTVKDANYFGGTIPQSEKSRFDTPPIDTLKKMNAEDFGLIGIRAEGDLKAPFCEPAQNILCELIKEDDGSVDWKYAKDLEVVDNKVPEKDMERVEQCVIMAKHTFFRPGASGAHGKIPKYPMHIMRGSIIKTIDSTKPFAIPKHEIALEKGMLVGLESLMLVRGEEPVGNVVEGRVIETRPYNVPIFKLKDGLGYLAGPLHRIIFVSHRWLSPNYEDWTKAHPDDENNSKLKLLQELVQDDDFVFFDYWSIPQEASNDENRMKAIASLMTYVDFSSSIFAICPTPKNRLEYDERGWTNLELLAGLVPVLKRRITHKWNTETIWGHSIADIRFVDGNGKFTSLDGSRLKNPFNAIFGVPQDLELITPIVKIIRESVENLQNSIKLYEENPSYASKITFNGVCSAKKLIDILTKNE